MLKIEIILALFASMLSVQAGQYQDDYHMEAVGGFGAAAGPLGASKTNNNAVVTVTANTVAVVTATSIAPGIADYPPHPHQPAHPHPHPAHHHAEACDFDDGEHFEPHRDFDADFDACEVPHKEHHHHHKKACAAAHKKHHPQNHHEKEHHVCEAADLDDEHIHHPHAHAHADADVHGHSDVHAHAHPDVHAHAKTHCDVVGHHAKPHPHKKHHCKVSHKKENIHCKGKGAAHPISHLKKTHPLARKAAAMIPGSDRTQHDHNDFASFEVAQLDILRVTKLDSEHNKDSHVHKVDKDARKAARAHRDARKDARAHKATGDAHLKTRAQDKAEHDKKLDGYRAHRRAAMNRGRPVHASDVHSAADSDDDVRAHVRVAHRRGAADKYSDDSSVDHPHKHIGSHKKDAAKIELDASTRDHLVADLKAIDELDREALRYLDTSCGPVKHVDSDKKKKHHKLATAAAAKRIKKKVNAQIQEEQN